MLEGMGRMGIVECTLYGLKWAVLRDEVYGEVNRWMRRVNGVWSVM